MQFTTNLTNLISSTQLTCPARNSKGCRIVAMCILVLPALIGCSTKPLDEMTTSELFTNPQVAALVHAAETGDVKTIDELVTKGIDVNARGRGNVTPLVCTYIAHNFDGFDRLLKHGANPNLLDAIGRAIVLDAAMDQDSRFLRRALESGGDPNLVNVGNRYHITSTPLFYAIGQGRMENVRLLVAAGANVHQQEDNHATPLSEALIHGNFEIAMLLIKAGADIHAKDRFGKNAVARVNTRAWALDTPNGKQSFRELIALMNSMGEKIPPYDD